MSCEESNHNENLIVLQRSEGSREVSKMNIQEQENSKTKNYTETQRKVAGTFYFKNFLHDRR